MGTEKFSPKEFDINSINGGYKFDESDGISVDAVNAPIEASYFLQKLAKNQPNINEANLVGVATASIETAPDGTPRFKFSNLKGEKGNLGIKIEYDGSVLYIEEME